MKIAATTALLCAIFMLCGVPRASAALLGVDAREQPAPPETGYLHFGTATSPKGETVGINSRYLTLDGKPWLPVMGEFHFTRVPQRRLGGRTPQDAHRRA